MRDARVRLVVLAVLASVAGGCGGGERQDADAPSGSFSLDVTEASFPEAQRVAESSTLRLDVANTGDREVPDLAVTVETEPSTEGAAPVAFGEADDDPALADSARPVWVLDRGPAGGETAYVNTWATGPLGSGRTRALTWKLTAVRPGRYTLNLAARAGAGGGRGIGGRADERVVRGGDQRRAGAGAGGCGRRGRPRAVNVNCGID